MLAVQIIDKNEFVQRRNPTLSTYIFMTEMCIRLVWARVESWEYTLVMRKNDCVFVEGKLHPAETGRLQEKENKRHRDEL